MAKPVKSRILGKNLLLSVAMGSVPIVGAGPVVAQEAEELVIAQAEIPAEIQAQFDAAAQSGDPALISQFILDNPTSGLVRRLLVNLPPETLEFINPAALAAISPTVARSLPPGTRVALGLDTVEGGSDGDAADDPSSGSTVSTAADGYAG